jgi:beta-galactosidase
MEIFMDNGTLLNLGWYFKEGFDESYINSNVEKDQPDLFERVNIPHTVKMIPYDCFDQTMTCMYSTYIRHFHLKDSLAARILLCFEGVSAYYDLYVNGRKVGSHSGAYSSALFDVTEYVHEGDNRMVLMVDSHERADIPPNGSTVDYLIYGGIYRDVTLYVKNKVYIRQPLMRYEIKSLDSESLRARVSIQPEYLVSNSGKLTKLDVMTRVVACNSELILEDTQSINISEGNNSVHLHALKEVLVDCWDIKSPVLYRAEIELRDDHGVVLDSITQQFGFRDVRAESDGFFLNGRKVKLIGENRHQSYPYIGYAMGKREQEKDAELLKKFLGLNIVRCSHYMQSKYFLDRCDEIGLMVFEEIPGWGFIGDDVFQENVILDLKNMVLGHFNHPGIVIWGTRLNETTDCDALYARTHALCKAMDPSRPTSGVRWETGSHLMEDIYSYNDYSEDERNEFVLLTRGEATGSPKKVPYLISEHTGAILPTKPWDSEERQEAFALRQAKVLAKINTMDEYLGAIGWCMFDYNTHNDHNSMNKVCYHGVLDMFRVPKMAAYVYASQKDLKDGVILEPCSMVGRGERCEPVPFWVMTNCEYITVKLSNDIERTYYPSVKYNGMAHPPIEVKTNGEFWQHRWTGAIIKGYAGGRCVAERRYSDNPHLSGLKIETDGTCLANNRVDETRIVAYYVDEYGNRLYFHRDVLSVSVEGDLDIIGPHLVTAMGGASAFYIRTKATGKAGHASVIMKSERPEIGEVRVEIELLA